MTEEGRKTALANLRVKAESLRDELKPEEWATYFYGREGTVFTDSQRAKK